MLPLRSEIWIAPDAGHDLSAGAWALLNHLRFVAMQCRILPRADLFEACALLHGSKSNSVEAHAETLMRCLPEALGHRARLHAPGVTKVSFDEFWLVQLAAASSREDTLSLRFLLQSRVAKEHRRLVAYLIGHITGHLALT